MKHLKSYNESILDKYKEIISDISDILLELTDCGYTTHVSDHIYTTGKGYIRIRCDISAAIRNEARQDWEFVEDIVLRIKDYAKLNNVNIEIQINGYSESSFLYNYKARHRPQGWGDRVGIYSLSIFIK